MIKAKNFFDRNYYLITFILSIAVLCLGIITTYYSNQSAYIDPIIDYKKYLAYQDGDMLKYLLSSKNSYENSILYSFIYLASFKGMGLDFYLTFGPLISGFLFFLCLIVFYSFKHKSYIYYFICMILMFNISFNNYYGFIIETKLIIIGLLLIYIFEQSIKNKIIKELLELAIIILCFNVVFFIIYSAKVIIDIIKKKNRLSDYINLVISGLMCVLLIRPSISFSLKTGLDAIINVYNYNSIGIVDYYNLFTLAFGILTIFVYFYYLFSSKNNRLEYLFLGVIVGVFTLYVMASTASVFEGYILKNYLSLFMLIVMAKATVSFNETRSLNLWNNEKLHFTLNRLILPLMLLVLGLGVFSFDQLKLLDEDYAYMVYYDKDYEYSKNRYRKNNQAFFEYDLKTIYEAFDVDFKIDLPIDWNSVSYKDDDIFLYGFGVQEDTNGSRWIEKKAACKMYSGDDDSLLISIFTPDDHAGVKFKIIVDNELLYEGENQIGTLNVKVTPHMEAGMHIVKIETDSAFDNRYQLFISNIVWGKF